jgi:predicted esterase
MAPTIPASKYKVPLIFEPSEEHRQTLIILHGRGSTAEQFAEPFLSHPVSPLNEGSTSISFREHFPHSKFVVPTASLRRAAIWKRSLTHQWFDNWFLDRPEYREELQLEGLRESSGYIHSLLRREIESIGARNVFLIGLSQGCATSLISILSWNGPALAGVLGMCGWLPFRERMEEVLQMTPPDPDDDPFQTVESDLGSRETANLDKARQWLVDELDLTMGNGHEQLRQVPIFLGHGKLDENVPMSLGKAASRLLDKLELHVTWEEYEGLGHWYSADMLRDMVSFIIQRIEHE